MLEICACAKNVCRVLREIYTFSMHVCFNQGGGRGVYYIVRFFTIFLGQFSLHVFLDVECDEK